MHVKITNHTLMGKRKSSLKGPTKKVMMRAKPSIMVPINKSPFAATKVVNPTTYKVLADELPFATTEVVHPTIYSEGNGGGQTNLQGRPTMPRVETTRLPVHDCIAQREELRTEKNTMHKQASCARLTITNDKTKGLTSRKCGFID
jgi:hypothetical protein